MPNCEDIFELAKAGEFNGGTCYNGPAGMEWIFPTIFGVIITLIVLSWVIPATAPKMFRRN